MNTFHHIFAYIQSNEEDGMKYKILTSNFFPLIIFWILGAALRLFGGKYHIWPITGKNSSRKILIGHEVDPFCYTSSHWSQALGQLPE